MITVRAATPDDAPAIALAHVEGWQVGYRGLIPDEDLDAIDLAARTDRWVHLLRSAPGTTLVAVSGAGGPDVGKAAGRSADQAVGIVGFVGFGPRMGDRSKEPLEGEIYALYVRPAAWGTGAARALMTAAERGLLEDGYIRALLSVLSGNARARRFYDKAGWVTDGRDFEHESRQPGMTRSVTVLAVLYGKQLGVHEAWPFVRAELAGFDPGDFRLSSVTTVEDGQLRAGVELEGGSLVAVAVPLEASLGDRVATFMDQVQDVVVEELWSRQRSTAWPECPEHPNRHPLRATVEDEVAVWECPVTGTAIREIGRQVTDHPGRERRRRRVRK